VVYAVSDKDWVAHALHAFAWMVPGELGLFGLDELERAAEGRRLTLGFSRQRRTPRALAKLAAVNAPTSPTRLTRLTRLTSPPRRLTGAGVRAPRGLWRGTYRDALIRRRVVIACTSKVLLYLNDLGPQQAQSSLVAGSSIRTRPRPPAHEEPGLILCKWAVLDGFEDSEYLLLRLEN